jgi:hypothetical protein
MCVCEKCMKFSMLSSILFLVKMKQLFKGFDFDGGSTDETKQRHACGVYASCTDIE